MKLRFGIALVFFLAGCNPQRFFYYPNQTLYHDPDKLGIPAELVSYPSLNGNNLIALYFKTDQTPRGTIVHFHGNFGNVSNHFPLSLFLVKNGFDVLVFDYQGYGASQGKPSPRNLVEDGVASVRWAQAHLRSSATAVGVFGQSLGAATGLVVAASEPLVKAVVAESAFTGHAPMARDVLKRSVFVWPLYPIAPLFVNRSMDPLNHVAKIAPRPIFLIHGDQDKTIPSWMSQKLFKAASEPKKLWIVEGGDHLKLRAKAGERYEQEIVDFFKTALKPLHRDSPY